MVAAVTAPETFEQPLPADPLVWHKLALAENGLGDREAARRAFERALWLAVDRGDGAHASEVAGALQKLARAAAGDSARR